MQIKLKGEMTLAELRQALFEQLNQVEEDYAVRYARSISRKRLANYLLPGQTRTVMMPRLLINIQRVQDEFQPIEKRDQPPALG